MSEKVRIFIIGEQCQYPNTFGEFPTNPYIRTLELNAQHHFGEKQLPNLRKIRLGNDYMYLIDQENSLYLAPFCLQITNPHSIPTTTGQRDSKRFATKSDTMPDFKIRRVHRIKFGNNKLVPLEVSCESNGPDHFLVLDAPTNVMYGWGKNPYGALGPDNPNLSSLTLLNTPSSTKMNLDPMPLNYLWDNLDRPNPQRPDQARPHTLLVTGGYTGPSNSHFIINGKWILIGLKCSDEQKNINFPLYMTLSERIT